MGPSPKALITLAVDSAIEIQQPAIDQYVARLRRWRPDSPELAIKLAEKQFLATATSLGAAAGAGAAAPGVGVGIGVAVTLVEISAYTEASALFVLACATIHGIDIEDLERRRLLLYAVLLGNGAMPTIEKVAGRTGPHWAKAIVGRVDSAKLRAINRVLGRNFITKYGTKQGILVLGRLAPFGIGAGIGGVGNAGLGYFTVRSARRAFGPAPERWAPEPDTSREPLNGASDAPGPSRRLSDRPARIEAMRRGTGAS